MGTASGGQSRVRHPHRSHVSNRQVRHGTRQSLHAGRRRRRAARVRQISRRGATGMNTDPSATFEPHRRRLLGLAYRMLGSMAEAEDAVQEAYLRWHDTDRESVVEPRAFLMTTTTRICLDVLKSARVKREEYVGPWLPDPVTDTASLAPDAQTELAEDLSVALLLALDRLSPLERAAFLLHDVFDYSFSQVAAALDRNEAACRQLASRARTRVREAQPQGVTPPRQATSAINPKHAELLSAFISATRTGDIEGLTRMLASDARVVTDGGGKVPAALNVIEGAERTAAFLAGVARKEIGRASCRERV